MTRDLFHGELCQSHILGGEQQRRQRHTVNRHKHTFPESHNPSAATPSPPRTKNDSTRWCVGIAKQEKTKRAGEHEKARSRYCGAQQRFRIWRYYGWWMMEFNIGTMSLKTLDTKRHTNSTFQDFPLSLWKNGNRSVQWTNEPKEDDSWAVERDFWVYTSLKFYTSAWLCSSQSGLNI